MECIYSGNEYEKSFPRSVGQQTSLKNIGESTRSS